MCGLPLAANVYQRLARLEFHGPNQQYLGQGEPVSLPNHTFPGYAGSSMWFTNTCAQSLARN